MQLISEKEWRICCQNIWESVINSSNGNFHSGNLCLLPPKLQLHSRSKGIYCGCWTLLQIQRSSPAVDGKCIFISFLSCQVERSVIFFWLLTSDFWTSRTNASTALLSSLLWSKIFELICSLPLIISYHLMSKQNSLWCTDKTDLTLFEGT